MRIARVLTRLNLGGPARQVAASDPILGQRGHTVRVFCGRPEPGEGDLTQELLRAGIDVMSVPGLGRGAAPLQDWRARRCLRRELAAFRPDVVHTHASKAGLLGRLAAPVGAALVHTFHGHVLEGYFPRIVGRGLAALEARLARRTDAIVAVSLATRSDLARLGVAREQDISVCPPGVELAPFLALGETPVVGELRGTIGADAFCLALVGRLAGIKQPRLAGEVLEQLVELVPSAHLVVVGDGPGRDEVLAGAGRARDRVHLLGARGDVSAVLAECDALLCCSRNEGMPVAAIEAAAAARPVVALPVGGLPELIEHQATGLLVTAGAGALELARAAARLAQDRELCLALGREARRRAGAVHSPLALVERLERIYELALARRSQRTAREVSPCGS